MKSPSDRALATLRLVTWGVAVVCLGLWGWAHLDAAHYRAAAERELSGAMTGSAAGVEAEALERAVERQLRAADAAASRADGASRRGRGDGNRAAGTVTATDDGAGRRAAAATVGTTGVVGRLRIPRLGLSVVVAEGIDRRTLRRAAGRIPGTAPLGGDGNVGIAGHRDGVFRDLERAAAGDLVLVDTPYGTDEYRIEAVRIVPPSATEVLAGDGSATLTLVTCFPFDRLGPAPERWVVRARRVGSVAG